MTPLAQRIARELTLPVRKRSFRDQCGLLDRLDDVHCFDVSAVFDLASDLSADMAERGQWAADLAFLPAPRTWLEWSRPEGREGVLLESIPEAAPPFGVGCDVGARCYWAAGSGSMFLSASRVGTLVFHVGRDIRDVPAARDLKGEPVDVKGGWVVWLYAVLAIINTPRIIGRRQHMPHAGLQRALARSRGMVGKFPLRAWTEIVLEVTPPRDASGEGLHEAHLTGRRALHFCRQHLRIRNGQLELVRAHWRGDPALGIKRSRYVVRSGRAA